MEEIVRSPHLQLVGALVLFVLAFVKAGAMAIGLALACAWWISIFGIVRSNRIKTLSSKLRLLIVLFCTAILGIVLSTLGQWVARQQTPQLQQEIKPEIHPRKAEPFAIQREAETVKVESGTGASLKSFPQVIAACDIAPDGSACELRCAISNDSDIAVKDVTIGFQGMLPLMTKLGADPDTQMKMQRSDTLPIPTTAGVVDPTIRAFTVHVPRIQPHTSLKFILWTASDENLMACRHEVRWAVRVQ